jgi:hypothetical protein
MFVSLGAIPGFASIIRFDFGGTIQTSDFGSVTVGTPFTGYLYYDTAAAPFFPVTGPGFAVANYIVPQAFLLNVGGSTVTADPSSPLESAVRVIDRDASQPQPPGATDSITFQLAGFKISGPLAGDVQTDHGLFLSFAGSPAVLDSVQLPGIFPDLGNWNNVLPDTSVGLVANPKPDVFLSFNGQFSSVSSSAVPEPAYFLAAPLFLGAAGWVSRRKRFL